MWTTSLSFCLILSSVQGLPVATRITLPGERIPEINTAPPHSAVSPYDDYDWYLNGVEVGDDWYSNGVEVGDDRYSDGVKTNWRKWVPEEWIWDDFPDSSGDDDTTNFIATPYPPATGDGWERDIVFVIN